MAYVGGVADEKHSDGDEDGTGKNEGTATAEAGFAGVAVEADDGLDDHAGDGAAEPNEGRPFVRDAQELNVGGQKWVVACKNKSSYLGPRENWM